MMNTLTIQQSDAINTLIEKLSDVYDDAFGAITDSCDYWYDDALELLNNHADGDIVLGMAFEYYDDTIFVWEKLTAKAVEEQLQLAYEERNPAVLKKYCAELAAGFGFKPNPNNEHCLGRKFGSFSIEIELSFEDGKSKWCVWAAGGKHSTKIEGTNIQAFELSHYDPNEDRLTVAKNVQEVIDDFKTHCNKSIDDLTKTTNKLNSIKYFEDNKIVKKKATKRKIKKKTAKRKAKKKV